MSGLVIKLRPSERILINGVVVQNGDWRAKLNILTPNANVLRLRDAIHPDDVKTPVKRVCYIAQMILAGEAGPVKGRDQLLSGIEQLSQVFTDPDSRMRLDIATENVVNNKTYPALKALRGLLSREQRLMERAL